MKSYSAQILRSVRKSLNVNQVEMSGRLNLSQGAISKIENGLLEFHALEWINFCRQFSIDPNILTLGIVTYLPNIVQIQTNKDFRTGLFKLPIKYGKGEQSKLHSLYPIINHLNQNPSQFDKFRAEVKESLKVDPDYFLVLDHTANIKLFNDFFNLKTVKAIKAGFAKKENFSFYQSKKSLKTILENIDSKNLENAIQQYVKNFATPIFGFNEYHLDTNKKTIKIESKVTDIDQEALKRYHQYQIDLLADFIKLYDTKNNIKVKNKDTYYQLEYA